MEGALDLSARPATCSGDNEHSAANTGFGKSMFHFEETSKTKMQQVQSNFSALSVSQDEQRSFLVGDQSSTTSSKLLLSDSTSIDDKASFRRKSPILIYQDILPNNKSADSSDLVDTQQVPPSTISSTPPQSSKYSGVLPFLEENLFGTTHLAYPINSTESTSPIQSNHVDPFLSVYNQLMSHRPTATPPLHSTLIPSLPFSPPSLTNFSSDFNQLSTRSAMNSISHYLQFRRRRGSDKHSMTSQSNTGLMKGSRNDNSERSRMTNFYSTACDQSIGTTKSNSKQTTKLNAASLCNVEPSTQAFVAMLPSDCDLSDPEPEAKRARIMGTSNSVSHTADESYWERRRKNNEAAKRSRDARRMKEEEIALRAAFLEQENLKLRAQVALLKNETAKLHYLLYNRI